MLVLLRLLGGRRRRWEMGSVCGRRLRGISGGRW
jgi:hypothetical protein